LGEFAAHFGHTRLEGLVYADARGGYPVYTKRTNQAYNFLDL